jgi:hypothetical protein
MINESCQLLAMASKNAEIVKAAKKVICCDVSKSVFWIC